MEGWTEGAMVMAMDMAAAKGRRHGSDGEVLAPATSRQK